MQMNDWIGIALVIVGVILFLCSVYMKPNEDGSLRLLEIWLKILGFAGIVLGPLLTSLGMSMISEIIRAF